MAYVKDLETDEDWTERLIEVVSAKPAIYDKTLEEHHSRDIVSRLWTEVCQEMLPNWTKLTELQREAKSQKFQARWRNLKTCFLRELHRQKLDISNQNGKKRRRYVHFDRLKSLFSSSAGELNEEIDTSMSHINLDVPVIELKDTAPKESTRPHSSEHQPKQRHHIVKHNRSKPIYKETFPKISERRLPPYDLDEDKMFLLSLIPSFRRMNDLQRLEAKVDFLNTIKRITQVASSDYEQANVSENDHQIPTICVQTTYLPSANRTTNRQTGSFSGSSSPPPDCLDMYEEVV